jgi:hypothetical protein
MNNKYNGETMNYEYIVKILKDASLFDINRLRLALDILLEDKEKILGIKRQLSVGMNISYFCNRSYKLSEAVIEDIRRTSVCARDKSDGMQWIIPFYLINLADANTDIPVTIPHEKLSRYQFQLGEHVGFVGRNNQEMYGVVTQLNPKTASINVGNGSKWRVSYELLFKVLDTYGAEVPKREMIEVTVM